MEPGFWSWEKQDPAATHITARLYRRNGAQLLELGKGFANSSDKRCLVVAMEPSFWSWEKAPITFPAIDVNPPVAMEPSFWSWEKGARHTARTTPQSRNGAQLLELGKARAAPLATTGRSSRNGAQLLELGKVECFSHRSHRGNTSQWSPAFGAGKSLVLSSGFWNTPEMSQWSPAFGAGKSWQRFFIMFW